MGKNFFQKCGKCCKKQLRQVLSIAIGANEPNQVVSALGNSDQGICVLLCYSVLQWYSDQGICDLSPAAGCQGHEEEGGDYAAPIRKQGFLKRIFLFLILSVDSGI